MPRAQWQLKKGRPVIEVVLTMALSGQKVVRTLLADTGAGNAHAHFELLLDENDCLLVGAWASNMLTLGGAYAGAYPVYLVPIEIPLLGFSGDLRTVGVPMPPKGLDGIAGFRFLNRFTYSNFGNPLEFGLET
jgi:hypothetical protein